MPSTVSLSFAIEVVLRFALIWETNFPNLWPISLLPLLFIHDEMRIVSTIRYMRSMLALSNYFFANCLSCYVIVIL
jgi:hypothetical protein